MSLLATAFWMLLTALAWLVAVPAALLLLQVLLALLPPRKNPTGGGRPTVGVLIPAHNESSGLLRTLAQARAQLEPGDRLLVVADNCSDDTAAVARGAGAEVTERLDTTLRGKGYALDHGVRFFAAAPPGVVVVLDADCELGPGCIARIATLAQATGRPVQALYLMRAANQGLKQRVAEFAMRMKNQVRPRGMHRLGLACGLTGTGMAFPWAVAVTAPLASGHLAEDMQLGVVLTERGVPPLLCEDAFVGSVFAGSAEGEKSQRTRWEHGHISLLLNQGPKLLVRALMQGRMALALVVMDLLVPPLALLALLSGAVLAAAAGVWLLAGWRGPLWVAAAGLAALALAVLLSRARFAADIVSMGDLLRAPGYVLAKLPLYVRYLVARQVDWVRTKRDS